MLNRFDRSSPMAGEAEVKYLDGDFRVLRPGAFVRCAVTGTPIPLEELKYWSVDLQEAYVSPEVVLQRHFPERGEALTARFGARARRAIALRSSVRNPASSSNTSVTGSACARAASRRGILVALHARQILLGRHQDEARRGRRRRTAPARRRRV